MVAKRNINGRECAVLKDLGGGFFHEWSLIEGEQGREVLRRYPTVLADELERQWLRWREAELGRGSADLLGFMEVGIVEGRPFVLRRWVEAESFDVQARRAKFNWRSPEDALEVGQSICRPIAALDRLGLVHGHITNNSVSPDAGTLATALAEVTFAEHQRTVHVRPAPLAKGVGDGMNPALKKAAIVVAAAGIVAGGAAFMERDPALERTSAISARGPNALPSVEPTPAPKDRVPSCAWTLDVPGAEPLTLIGMLPFEALLGHASEKNNPPHTVVVTQPFSLSTHQITVSQFADFVRATNYTTTAETAGDDTQRQVWSVQGNRIAAQPGLSWKNPGFPQDPSHPVTSISWDDAQAFCVWLSSRSGLQVRLPTEAEWEFCARAGAETKYAWGDDPAGAARRANVADQKMKQAFPGLRSAADWDDGFAYTAPVASFPPNALGFYDLGGNVWEWCQDRFSEAPFPSRSVDPVGPAQGATRSFRGSAYNEFPPNGLSYRYGNMPTMGCTLRGFRIAVSGEWRTLEHAANLLSAAQVTRAQVGSFIGIEGTIVKYVPSPEPRTPHVLTLVDRSPNPLEIIYWDNDAAPAIHARYGTPAVGRRVSVAGVLADYRGRLQVRVLRLEQIEMEGR